MQSDITDVLGRLPFRLALAGGWIDQPFVSRLNPSPPGSMVVVGVEPEFWFMERAGICIGTRNIAMRLWNGELPDGDPDRLVQELYDEENRGKAEPSGSQDMIGLVYPGVNRLDYDFTPPGRRLPPAHRIQQRSRRSPGGWRSVIHILPVNQRPEGYNPLEIKNLDPAWIERLGRSGRDCYDAIVARDIAGSGRIDERVHAVLGGDPARHGPPPHDPDRPAGPAEALSVSYPGAMYSGCGGGYLYVVSQEPVPGAFGVKVRIGQS